MLPSCLFFVPCAFSSLIRSVPCVAEAMVAVLDYTEVPLIVHECSTEVRRVSMYCRCLHVLSLSLPLPCARGNGCVPVLAIPVHRSTDLRCRASARPCFSVHVALVQANSQTAS